MATNKTYPCLTADEAAVLIPNGAMVAVSGFTPAGAPKSVPRALAKRARELHHAGTPFQVKLLSGASTGAACDDELAAAEAVSWRAPYMTSAPMRQLANTGKIEFVDMHLSHVAQVVMEGFLGPIDFAIIEATEITPDGKVYLTTGIGNTPTFLQCADKVIIELNAYHSPRLREITDILMLPTPPRRIPTPIHDPLDRLGRDYATVNPSKVIAVVHTNEPDGGRAFAAPDESSRRIAEHVAGFFMQEIRSGRIPSEFLPLQSGVGNICNAVLSGLASCKEIPRFKVYTEVLQDAMLDLIASGKSLGASATALTLSDQKLKFLYQNFDEFADRIVLRPQEISNNPGIARQLGVIATNTAIEVDLYGHVNSTHIMGTQIVNGLGGSGDFERNAYLLRIHVSVNRQRRPDLDDRADVLAHRPQRTFCTGGRHGAGPGRSSRSCSTNTGAANHRELRAPRVSRRATPVFGKRTDGPHRPRFAPLFRHAPELSRAWSDAAGVGPHDLRAASGLETVVMADNQLVGNRS